MSTRLVIGLMLLVIAAGTAGVRRTTFSGKPVEVR